MFRKSLCLAAVLCLVAAGSAFAGSNFQQTCSNIAFAYSGGQPTITATCLTPSGSPNATSLVLQGISNQNGNLVQGSGASSFQQSCGNVQIVVVDANNVNLTAFCRTSSGGSNATSLALNGISNNGGKLSQ